MLIRKTAHLALGLLLLAAVPGAFAYQNDYAQDVQSNANPSPVDSDTGSSINQFGTDQTNSQIDNYAFQDEQINLDRFSGTVKVLRANQKALINKYVTAVVPLHQVNPRELRGMARTICRKEGGDADVLQDKVTKEKFLVVVCPEFQIPFIMKTLHVIDQPWVKEVNNGSWSVYYKARNRDVRSMMTVLGFYRSPDGVWDFDDANNAVLFYDQPNVEPLFKIGTEAVDIPPSQVSLDVAIYEVDTQNNLSLGFDFANWKNGPGRNLFELVAWNFNGNNPSSLFPGGAPLNTSDWGSFRSYNIFLTTAYLDFMQVKGKARLLTKATITARSGSVGELAAVDQVVSFQASSSPAPVNQTLPVNLSAVIEFFHESGAAPDIDELLKGTPDQIIDAIQSLLNGLGVSPASVAVIVNTLKDEAKDGGISRGELNNTSVPMEITLKVFHDRTLRYLRNGQVGVLLSVLPVVGLQSAELSMALDVSDVTGNAPSGTPIIEHRYFSSAVELKDGQPFVLSGLKRSSNVKSGSGIPFLRDIPWLGYLFGHEVSAKSEKELVVLITPRFRLCPTAEAAPVKELETAVKLATGQLTLDVPNTSLGFDQWLLDTTKPLPGQKQVSVK